MTLPEKGWKGYGSPQHPRTPSLEAAQEAIHIEVSEYRLRTEGIKPELTAYVRALCLQGIGK